MAKIPSTSALFNDDPPPRAQDNPSYDPALAYEVPLDQEGKTCTDNQDYSPYGTKRQPLSSNPFATTGLKKGLGDPVG